MDRTMDPECDLVCITFLLCGWFSHVKSIQQFSKKEQKVKEKDEILITLLPPPHVSDVSITKTIMGFKLPCTYTVKGEHFS